ncbi:hypothetical protein SAMN05421881_102919 [Nitrosomonas halophila]|uniref:Uncharacterized protein n=1 Tax=Nitrosomonas halophila TaxID=44576 RepID=A0A1H3J0R4_9PROT|nr:hypothetical protein SAMN05421881_102919 [Nitrosomonas halophila]
MRRCIKDLNGKIIIGMQHAATPATQRCNRIAIIECDHTHAVKNGLARLTTNGLVVVLTLFVVCHAAGQMIDNGTNQRRVHPCTVKHPAHGGQPSHRNSRCTGAPYRRLFHYWFL